MFLADSLIPGYYYLMINENKDCCQAALHSDKMLNMHSWTLWHYLILLLHWDIHLPWSRLSTPICLPEEEQTSSTPGYTSHVIFPPFYFRWILSMTAHSCLKMISLLSSLMLQTLVWSSVIFTTIRLIYTLSTIYAFVLTRYSNIWNEIQTKM